LHLQPELLESYPCVLTVGHDEYWSWEMRDAIDKYVDSAGAFARFGGNIFWQIRISDNAQLQTCYKYLAHAEDPVRNGTARRLLTSGCEDPLIGRPAATTFGVNAPHGGYAGFAPPADSPSIGPQAGYSITATCTSVTCSGHPQGSPATKLTASTTPCATACPTPPAPTAPTQNA
jgi:hypothetical protein